MDAIKKAFTGKDNETIDLGRCLWAITCLFFCGASIYAIMQGQPFEPVNWGTGAAAVLGGGGAAIGFKAKTEPKSDG
jgi:hypothetical protein